MNSKICHFIVDNWSYFISLQFWPAHGIGYDVYVSRVLNNSTGTVDCTGRGQTAGISNCTGLNKRRRYAFKINNCTGLTLREEKSATRKECRIN